MSTDITGERKACPACGQENPPMAVRCWLCGEERLSAPRRTQPTGEAGSGCSTAGKVIGVVFLGMLAVFVTFFLVCAAAFANWSPAH